MKFVLPETLPPEPEFENGIRRAPDRGLKLSKPEIHLALENALRYIPKSLHKTLLPEFLNELKTKGRIYGYRYRPQGKLYGKPVNEYQGCLQARAIQVMIDNNLDFDVALYPYELVTYGETGQVFQNWMQYRLVKLYLEEMQPDQTLVLISGHPVGLFKTNENAPRLISTNGLMIGMFDTPEEFHRASALGVANYGQMTAGGMAYIGPQGIVHGTYLTLLNTARLFLNAGKEPRSDGKAPLAGLLFVSSGLGGMSGAQPKASNIAGAVSIIAEVEESRIETRHSQGWVDKKTNDLKEAITWAKQAMNDLEPLSIAYHGNVVDLLEYLNEKSDEIHVSLLSDQTSCHATYEGGYTPVGYTYEEARELAQKDEAAFRKAVDASLVRHYEIIEKLSKKDAKSVFDAGVHRAAKNNDAKNGFLFPSYVEDVMGPICFDYGYGPFRYVALSRKHDDLKQLDAAAMEAIELRREQDRDNYAWIRHADKNRLVVGTQARILYADASTRVRIALRFNELVKSGAVGPVYISRDHHDCASTDSPFRETANIKDGSNIMSEMAHHSWAGNAARGMTMCVLSNGGGVGTGKAYNGGFGLVLDGTPRVDNIVRCAMDFDVMLGVARRSWARNKNAIDTAAEWNEKNSDSGHISLPNLVDPSLLENVSI